MLMDEKLPPSGPSGFPDWDNDSSPSSKDGAGFTTFSPSDTLAPPPPPSTTIPVSTDFSDDVPKPPEPPKPEPDFKSFDSMVQPPSPPTPPPQEVMAPEPPSFDDGKAGDAEHPLAVTQVYSSYGIEYLIMLISLAVLAFSLAAMLNAIVDLSAAKSGSSISSFLDPYSEASLIVSLPIFAYLFLRLEAREESHSSFLADSSRRRGIQIILVVSFLFFIGELIGYIGTLLGSGSESVGSYLNPLSTDYGYSVADKVPWWSDLLHAIIGLVIAGGIFAYFWYKLHKKTGTELL